MLVFHQRFWISSTDMELYTDSAGSIGFGIYFADKWAYAQVKIRDQIRHNGTGFVSNSSVLVPSGDKLCNNKIMFHCDNAAVFHVINTMTSESETVMTLLRTLTLRCLQLNTAAKINHISSNIT